MFVAEIKLKCRAKNDRETCEDAIWGLLAALYKNGQILPDYFLAENKQGYCAFVQLPEENSLQQAHNRKYVRQSYAQLNEAGVAPPIIKILGRTPQILACACRKPASYILYTHFLDITSCLCCGDCFKFIPLYRIPPTCDDNEYYDLLQWQADYQACDTLQMHCATGERFGTRELSEVNSSLSQRGRKICQKIEQLTQTPTYYYLYRSNSGRNLAAEQSRKCPACGKAWALAEPFHFFDFRCDPCRLLSNISWNLR
jgi:predicted  nucleic acid-binding Zn ribbon protein